jgi:hypothetical protein
VAVGLWERVKRTFVAPKAERNAFNYESPAYSLLIKGMFGQQPEGRGSSLSSREQAMEIPAVARGRNLICSLATLPLEEIDERNVVRDNPLLAQIDPNVANVVTLAQTFEDLLFDSVAWWRVTGFDPFTGMPSRAIRMDPSQVSLQQPADYQQGWLPSNLPTTGVVWMAGEAVPWDQVIRFDSPNRPLMQTLRRAVVRAIKIDLAAEMYADNPRPADYFRPSDPTTDPLDDDGITELLQQWSEARKARSTAYVPAALEYQTVQQPTPAELQLAQLQQRVSLDIANAMGLDPEDLGISTTSRTYQNATDRRRDRINDTLSPYISAVTQRLAMPDVTLPGRRTRMNLDEYLRADPKTRAEVAAIYLDKKVVTREYVAATIEGLPPDAIPVDDPEPEAEPEADPEAELVPAVEVPVDA